MVILLEHDRKTAESQDRRAFTSSFIKLTVQRDETIKTVEAKGPLEPDISGGDSITLEVSL